MPLGENTRFLAALEIEVGAFITAAYPSLRFGMTRLLRTPTSSFLIFYFLFLIHRALVSCCRTSCLSPFDTLPAWGGASRWHHFLTCLPFPIHPYPILQTWSQCSL